MTDTPDAEAYAQLAAGPEPAIAGTFAVYTRKDGGYVLVTECPGEEPRQTVIPAAIVKAAQGQGILGRRLAGLFGRGGSD